MEPQEAPLAPGLYLVATPIGNLGDITLRALDVLKHVDRIACEDTRQTQKLLNHFQIATPTVSCHQHNEHNRATELIQNLKAGRAHRPRLRRRNARHQRPRRLARRRGHRRRSPRHSHPRSQCRAQRAGSLRPAHRRISLPRLSAGKSRRAPHAGWKLWPPKSAANSNPAHPDFLRSPAPHSRDAGRSRIRLGSEPARSRSPRADQDSRGVSARHGSRGAPRTRCPRSHPRRDHPARRAAAPNPRGPGPLAFGDQGIIADRIAQIQAESKVDEKEALKRLARELGQSKSELYRELQRERARLKTGSRGTRNAP